MDMQAVRELKVFHEGLGGPALPWDGRSSELLTLLLMHTFSHLDVCLSTATHS
jgi:hypothetical protein